jgi:hypothetical protein
MRGRTQKTIALIMLFISLVMGVGAYGLNSKWLMHDLAHDTQAPASGDHQHELRLASQGTPAPQPLSEAEHKLLHVLSYCEQLPSLTFVAFNEPPARLIPAMPDLLTLLPAALESPFRPPRGVALS